MCIVRLCVGQSNDKKNLTAKPTQSGISCIFNADKDNYGFVCLNVGHSKFNYYETIFMFQFGSIMKFWTFFFSILLNHFSIIFRRNGRSKSYASLRFVWANPICAKMSFSMLHFTYGNEKERKHYQGNSFAFNFIENTLKMNIKWNATPLRIGHDYSLCKRQLNVCC